MAAAFIPRSEGPKDRNQVRRRIPFHAGMRAMGMRFEQVSSVDPQPPGARWRLPPLREAPGGEWLLSREGWVRDRSRGEEYARATILTPARQGVTARRRRGGLLRIGKPVASNVANSQHPAKTRLLNSLSHQ
jgi:hypothetical protein